MRNDNIYEELGEFLLTIGNEDDLFSSQVLDNAFTVLNMIDLPDKHMDAVMAIVMAQGMIERVKLRLFFEEGTNITENDTGLSLDEILTSVLMETTEGDGD